MRDNDREKMENINNRDENKEKFKKSIGKEYFFVAVAGIIAGAILHFLI